MAFILLLTVILMFNDKMLIYLVTILDIPIFQFIRFYSL